MRHGLSKVSSDIRETPAASELCLSHLIGAPLPSYPFATDSTVSLRRVFHCIEAASTMLHEGALTATESPSQAVKESARCVVWARRAAGSTLPGVVNAAASVLRGNFSPVHALPQIGLNVLQRLRRCHE